MDTAVIKISNLDHALMLSRAYKEGEIINATINMYKNDHIKMYKINST